MNDIILPDGREAEPWTIHLLVGREGMQSPSFTVREVRKLVLQERRLIEEVSQNDEGRYLRDLSLHRQMDLGNPFVEVAVRTMLYEFACDSPSLPNWSPYEPGTRAYIAYICATAFLRAQQSLTDLPKEDLLEDRQNIIISEARMVYRAAVRTLNNWRAEALSSFRFDDQNNYAEPPFPDWDLVL